MDNEFYFLIGSCGGFCAAFCLVWFPLQRAATELAYDEFRDKGFLEIPSGLEWFPFLLREQYDLFENRRARTFFCISRICALGAILSLSTGVLLIGSDLLLKVVP